MPKYITKNTFQTRKVGRDLAKKILKGGIKKRAIVLGLKGDLGGGKTTFLQGFARGLGIKEKILSPTFIILRKSQIPASPARFAEASARRAGGPNPKSLSRRPASPKLQRGEQAGQINSKSQIQKPKQRFTFFYHIDFYRIKKPKEILDIGFKRIIFDPQNIIAIEWADRIRKILPKNAILIKFDFIDKEKRQIVIKNFRY